jgi:hypothetical protein
MSSVTSYDAFSGNLDELFKEIFLRPIRFDVDAAPQTRELRDLCLGYLVQTNQHTST